MNRKWMTLFFVGILALAGCNSGVEGKDKKTADASEVSPKVVSDTSSQEKQNSQIVDNKNEMTEKGTDEGNGENKIESKAENKIENDTEKIYPEIDVQKVRPNELGEVMVVMYHGLGEKNSAYVRTVESFKKDLETYYNRGFRPINLSDYVKGEIETPAGFTPIVLTFDDGNQSNFNYIEQEGKQIIDPNCVVGILLNFHEKHPDWSLKGSFFLNGGVPFRQKGLVDKKVNWLIENGFEVGNHSYGHEDLSKLDEEGIEKTLGSNIQELEARMEGYTVDTLALPFGKRPKDEKRYNTVTKGTYKGIDYKHIAILLVGWKPEVSVFDKAFDPLAIMRVQSGDGEFQMIHWLADYESHPQKRFISDGNPNKVTVPAKMAEKLNADVVGEREIVTYTPEN